MKKILHSFLPAGAALALTVVTATDCAPAASTAHSNCRHDACTNQDSAAIGPDYYSSNDNPFHAD